MQARLPRIARDVIERNPDYPARVRDAVERLARDIETDAPLRAPVPPACDMAPWSEAYAEHAGETWLATEWFHAELAFYRELVHACLFWETGRDPFAPIKREELSGDRPWSRLKSAVSATERSRMTRISSLLEACLWGNRVDLSYAVAASRAQGHDDDLLVDERAAAVLLLARTAAHVHFVADNAGTELALDLALVGGLLEDPGTQVTVHLKIQPTFVSDAMPCDVWELLDRMRDRGGAALALAGHLDDCFRSGRLKLVPDPFWTGPRFLWHAPPHLRESLASATIVVLKGDANYRRLIGDALWPPATPLAEACAFLPAPVVCLRTMKSDPILGLPEGLAERLDAAYPSWRIDGKRGVMQTVVP
jgi:uncharacterized protein with ATP-grasp and redox domains